MTKMGDDTYEERQDNELAALQAIYGDEVIDNRMNTAWKIWRPLDLMLTLIPLHNSDIQGVHCSVTLHFKCCASYPDKKRKGKGKAQDTKSWVPCPLLPGVPAVPPPHVPQPWEIRRDMKKRAKEAHDITEEKEEVKEDKEEEEVLEDSPPGLITIPHRLLLGRKTAADSVMENDACDELPLVVIPGSSTAETIPSSQTKLRKIRFSPSTGIIQCAVSPQNPVMADIELVGFTPSSTTSTQAPGSGRSDFETDNEVVNFGEPNEGSDVDLDDVVDVALNPRNVDEFADVEECLEDPVLAAALGTIDNAADAALRSVVGQEMDLLHFDWRSDPDNFEGVREEFVVPSTGPTFDTTDMTPSDVFFKIWDTNIIAHIVHETNRYGNELMRRNVKPNSRITRWRDVTEEEIIKFLSIVMLQSLVINNVEREYWYPKLEELRIGNFGAIMPFNRFIAIKRCLHFVDNTSLPEHPNRLHKIMPIIEHLNGKFSSLYLLEQNVAIDESLLLWKGRVPFAQKILTKKARVGIKSYELCESRTGYLWRMEVYSGKGHVHTAQTGVVEEPEMSRDEPESATSQIVLTLMRPLFNKGHTLVMDNFYNAPLLSRLLKVKHNTDTMGTLRLNREFVPEALKGKTKANMKPGEAAFSTTKDLSVVVWMDKSVTAMISSFHAIEVGGIEKYGNYRYKPKVILDYNLSMVGVDHKDQMLHAFPVERVRNIIWYKKVFRRLLNVSIHNAFVIFNHKRTQILGNREFRLQLVKELLQTSRSEAISRPLPMAVASSEMHLPVKNDRPQRCKMCYAAKLRRSTRWRCGTCSVNLCIEGCYTAYHSSM